ncbi:MAG: zinc-ribbon domain-containing protein, partial [Oribacterium sp.]|nr:zinc-ribbon domain-containing protein [Oribacterium sp.]
MAFCTNCGSEIPEGTKFCANCGAPVGSTQNNNNDAVDKVFESSGVYENQPGMDNQRAYEQNAYQQKPYMGQQADAGNVTGLDKYGKFIGIGLLILAIVDFATDPPILTIILSAGIIGGAIFCLTKKFKLKGFPIAAIVLAAFCLLAGVTQANKYGMFKIPGNEKIAEDLSEERTTVTEQVA